MKAFLQIKLPLLRSKKKGSINERLHLFAKGEKELATTFFQLALVAQD